MDSKTKNKKPGDTMLGIGVGLLVFAVVFAFLPLLSSDPQFGSPGAWLMLLAGLVLAAFGFAKRVLAALERR